MKLRNLILFLCLICTAALVATWYGSREFKENLLEQEATGDAVRWGLFVASRSQGIRAEVAKGHISKKTRDALDIASSAGGVFRYKLFGPDGIIIHASRPRDIGKRNTKPYFEKLVRKGRTFTKIVTDEKFGGDRTVVSEAYVPLMEEGRFVGAIEVYVDATDTAATLDRATSYAFLGVAMLMSIVAIIWILFVWGDAKIRLRLEKSLNHQNARFNTALDNMTQGLCVFDGEQRLVVCNERYASMYGLSSELMRPGTTLREIAEFRIANGVYSGTDPDEYINERLAWVTSRSRSTKIQHLNNGRSIKITHTPMSDDGWLTTHEDITDITQAHKSIQRQKFELERSLSKEKELNKLQREFVSMASHEFRTPLAIIDATAQRMKSRADTNRLTPEDAAQRVGKIRDAVQRMTRLMESTLDAARMEEGKIKLKIEPCDIGTVVREVCARQQEITQTHVISCDLAGLPETIQADTGSVEQVLTNLFSNAVKYAPGAPDIEVKAQTQGGQVVISVRDRGIGIDEDDMDRIGERFFRAQTSTGIVGTGIGLNLAKTLVEMHGGTLNVASRKGEGSTFTIRLPIAGPGQPEQAGTRAA